MGVGHSLGGVLTRSRTFRPEVLTRLSQRLPEARAVTVTGTGHLLPMEKPGETAAAIRAFLTET